ncbi:MAG: hypothetical protein ACFCUV_12980 [Rivularia sp. (in: cyanobacteria)]
MLGNGLGSEWEMGRWGDGETRRWGDKGMGGWGEINCQLSTVNCQLLTPKPQSKI